MFPKSYDIRLDNSASDYSCQTSLVESTGDVEKWNDDSTCTANYNWIMLDAKAYTLEVTDLFDWEISGITNPEKAFTRTAATNWDFDRSDKDLNMQYHYYTEKFEMFTYDLSKKSYTGRSYCNLNSAYVGFDYAYSTISVNGGTRITVYAGSYTTDKYITANTNGQMASKSIKLTPSNNTRVRKSPDSNIDFQSPVHDYTMYGGVTQIAFRVGAGISLAKGIYYINWAIEETSYSANSATIHYHQPAKTMVEVVAKTTNKFAFVVDSFTGGKVYVGTYSPDISVSISNSPFTDVSVKLALSGGADPNIVFEPASLSFGPLDHKKSFRIKVESAYDLTKANPQTIVFTTDGTDAVVFAAPANLAFNVSAAESDTTAGAISAWAGTTSCTQTSCTVTPSVNKVGTIWWAISAAKSGTTTFAEASCPTSADITTNAARPSASEESKTDAQKENDKKTTTDYKNTETDPATGETWA